MTTVSSPRTAAGVDFEALKRLWKPVSVLLFARVVMLAGLYVYQHVLHRFVVNNWDGGWYIYAAQHGWPHKVLPGFGDSAQDTLAFFPGFPTAIRVVHFVLPVSWTRAGEGAALLTQIAMVIGLWILTRDIWGTEVADRTIVLFCFFPGAFIFAILYSEPMLIALACLCLIAMRRRWWLIAGLAASLGGATRVVGLALVACCAWESWQAIRQRREWRSLRAVLLSPLAVVGWFAYLWASTGDKYAWFDTEKNGWAQKSSIMAIPHLVQAVLHDRPAQPNVVVPFLSTLIAVVLFALLIKVKAPALLVVYAAAVLLISATFVMTAFPLIMVLGYKLKGDVYALVVAASAVLMTSILVVTMTGATLIP
jgi:hypothetical protein